MLLWTPATFTLLHHANAETVGAGFPAFGDDLAAGALLIY